MSQEECKGGDCPLRPQFDDCEDTTQGSKGNKKVRLSTSKYVQLLIDARETDPECWPPGLEKAAAMLEDARAIEDECIAKWGDFDPDKLSRTQNRKYFEIQLALDTLQEEAEDTPLDIEDALNEARHNLDKEDAAPAPSTPQPHATYVDMEQVAPPPSEGFFADGVSRTTEFFLAQEAPHEEARTSVTPILESGWVEIPPLQRGDNYA
jgi:hypothetical protein